MLYTTLPHGHTRRLPTTSLLSCPVMHAILGRVVTLLVSYWTYPSRLGRRCTTSYQQRALHMSVSDISTQPSTTTFSPCITTGEAGLRRRSSSHPSRTWLPLPSPSPALFVLTPFLGHPVGYRLFCIYPLPPPHSLHGGPVVMITIPIFSSSTCFASHIASDSFVFTSYFFSLCIYFTFGWVGGHVALDVYWVFPSAPSAWEGCGGCHCCGVCVYQRYEERIQWVCGSGAGGLDSSVPVRCACSNIYASSPS